MPIKPATHNVSKRTATERAGKHSKLYTTKRWRKARARFLRDNPLCVMCQALGRVTAAAIVDHIKPHRGDMALFWSEDNWQPLCKQHHDSTKQAMEKGGKYRRIGVDGYPV
jgi:5-methylcytosine-specific restriction endonuclease McrA